MRTSKLPLYKCYQSCDTDVAELSRRRDQAQQLLADLEKQIASAIERAAAELVKKTDRDRLKTEIVAAISPELPSARDAIVIASYLIQEEFNSWPLIRSLDVVTLRTVLEYCFRGTSRPEWCTVRLGQVVKLLNALKGSSDGVTTHLP